LAQVSVQIAQKREMLNRLRIPLGSRSLYIAKLEQMKLSAHGETRDEA
jgi:hypothetical protein